MMPLSRQGAEYFCRAFSWQSVPDMRNLYDTVLGKKKSIKEGDGFYEQYRDSLLRESDRSFFLAVSCFRRALDLFTASSVFWVYVSLYYCSWFAAQSALGMFGCWVGGPRGRSGIVIQAQQQAPGHQEFIIDKNYTSYPSSHRFFWDAYYRAMTPVVFWTNPSLHLAVTPISNNRTWAIDRRNNFNYRSSQAFKLMDEYTKKFNPSTFPTSLPGDLCTQFKFAKTMLLFGAAKAVDFRLKTDVFQKYNSRAEAIRQLIYTSTPVNLSRYSEENSLAI